MIKNETIIIYSALHTGTWFTSSLLQHAAFTTHVESDQWFSLTFNHTIENLLDSQYLSIEKTRDTIIENNRCPKDVGTVILQAHQRSDSKMYQSLCKDKPEVLVVVPIRDPLLSLHSRIWRECEDIKNVNKDGREVREERIIDQLNSIERILSIPKENVCFFPIDINNRIESANNVISYCGFSHNKAKDYIAKWEHVNTTQYKVTSQQTRFENIKNAIKFNNTSIVRKHMSIELKIIKEWNNKHTVVKDKLTELGYKDLLWW